MSDELGDDRPRRPDQFVFSRMTGTCLCRGTQCRRERAKTPDLNSMKLRSGVDVRRGGRR